MELDIISVVYYLLYKLYMILLYKLHYQQSGEYNIIQYKITLYIPII